MFTNLHKANVTEMLFLRRNKRERLNYKLCNPRPADDVTCESEAAMLERNKLVRATISRLLRKCYFSRRSERRAPSIPRALKRNEKACT